jgi:hypothetical protein
MKTISFNEWRREKDKQQFVEWLGKNGYDPNRLDVDQLIDEGAWDRVKKFGRNALMTGLVGASMLGGMGSNPSMAAAPRSPQEIKQAFDNQASDSTLTPAQWKQLASQYPGDRLGFVPNPHKVGSWIPAGGADAVRVQAFTNVNNDELQQDTIGLTPYKGGKPTRTTDWSDGLPGQKPTASRATVTKVPGMELYKQAMSMPNSR